MTAVDLDALCPSCGDGVTEEESERIAADLAFERPNCPVCGDTITRICRSCGCTDTRACLDPVSGDPCHWAEDDLCSVCDSKLEAA